MIIVMCYFFSTAQLISLFIRLVVVIICTCALDHSFDMIVLKYAK